MKILAENEAQSFDTTYRNVVLKNEDEIFTVELEDYDNDVLGYRINLQIRKLGEVSNFNYFESNIEYCTDFAIKFGFLSASCIEAILEVCGISTRILREQIALAKAQGSSSLDDDLFNIEEEE